MRSTLKIALRKKQLHSTFRTFYEDLLKAISNDSYEALETLCEETLLEELAAKIYELEKFHNVQFRIISNSQGKSSDIDINIINHFYIRNMSVNRAENPSLKNYQLV